MINIIEAIKFVFSYMKEKKGRTILTISGIIIGIFTFTFFIFAAQGLSNAITEQFSSFGLNVLGVSSAENSQNRGPPGGGGITDTDIARITQVIRDYKYITPQIFYSDQYEFGRERAIILAAAFPDEYLNLVYNDLELKIEEGRLLRPGDRSSVVLGAKAVESFGSDNPLRIGNSIRVNQTSFRVVGILKERGDLFLDNTMFMSFGDIQRLSNLDTYTSVRISFYENADLNFMKKRIEERLNPNPRFQNVIVTSPQQAIDQFNQIIGVLQLIIGFISSIALMVGGINVMNTMYSNILERINEISVMKALGATNSDIRNLFLIESSVLGLIGATIGFLLSFTLAKILSYLITTYAGYNLPINFNLTFFLLVIGITSLFSMIFGTYPAIKAANINPSDNLRDD